MSQKMNDISTQFCLIEPALIRQALLMGSEITRPKNSPRFLCNSKIILDQQSEQSDSGTSWKQTFRGVSSARSLMNWNNRRAYIGIYRTDGSIIVIGSPNEAPLIIVTPNVGTFVAEATFETVSPAII